MNFQEMLFGGGGGDSEAKILEEGVQQVGGIKRYCSERC